MKDFSFNQGLFGNKEHRSTPRLLLKLKVAIIYHQHVDEATRPTYHGHTNDVSLGGLSVIVDHNIFNEDDVTVLLALPPEKFGAPMQVVEATARMVYTVHSSDHQAFRVGLSFKQFARNGKALLEARLARV